MVPFEIPAEHARRIKILLSSYPSGPVGALRKRTCFGLFG